MDSAEAILKFIKGWHEKSASSVEELPKKTHENSYHTQGKDNEDTIRDSDNEVLNRLERSNGVSPSLGKSMEDKVLNSSVRSEITFKQKDHTNNPFKDDTNPNSIENIDIVAKPENPVENDENDEIITEETLDRPQNGDIKHYFDTSNTLEWKQKILKAFTQNSLLQKHTECENVQFKAKNMLRKNDVMMNSLKIFTLVKEQRPIDVRTGLEDTEENIDQSDTECERKHLIDEINSKGKIGEVMGSVSSKGRVSNPSIYSKDLETHSKASIGLVNELSVSRNEQQVPFISVEDLLKKINNDEQKNHSNRATSYINSEFISKKHSNPYILISDDVKPIVEDNTPAPTIAPTIVANQEPETPMYRSDGYFNANSFDLATDAVNKVNKSPLKQHNEMSILEEDNSKTLPSNSKPTHYYNIDQTNMGCILIQKKASVLKESEHFREKKLDNNPSSQIDRFLDQNKQERHSNSNSKEKTNLQYPVVDPQHVTKSQITTISQNNNLRPMEKQLNLHGFAEEVRTRSSEMKSPLFEARICDDRKESTKSSIIKLALNSIPQENCTIKSNISLMGMEQEERPIQLTSMPLTLDKVPLVTKVDGEQQSLYPQTNQDISSRNFQDEGDKFKASLQPKDKKDPLISQMHIEMANTSNHSLNSQPIDRPTANTPSLPPNKETSVRKDSKAEITNMVPDGLLAKREDMSHPSIKMNITIRKHNKLNKEAQIMEKEIEIEVPDEASKAVQLKPYFQPTVQVQERNDKFDKSSSFKPNPSTDNVEFEYKGLIHKNNVLYTTKVIKNTKNGVFAYHCIKLDDAYIESKDKTYTLLRGELLTLNSRYTSIFTKIIEITDILNN